MKKTSKNNLIWIVTYIICLNFRGGANDRFSFSNSPSATDFRIPQASPATILVFVLILSFIFIAVLVSFIVQERQKKKKLTDHREKSFVAGIKKYRLNPGEAAQLRRIARNISPDNYTAVFTSLEFFETAVDTACQDIRKKWGLTAKAENATLLLHTIRTKLGYDAIPYEQSIVSTRNINHGQFIQIKNTDTESVYIEQAVFTGGNELTFSLYYKRKAVKKDVSGAKQVLLDFTRSGDGAYFARVSVVAVYPSDGHIVLEHTQELDRNQLRKHLRMVVDMDFKCRVIRRANKQEPPFVGKALENTKLIDIGGGGVAFISTQSLEPDDMVSLMFTLERKKYALKGRIIAVSQQEGRSASHFKHRVCFEDIDSGEVEGIVKYIFRKQREQVQLLSGHRRG